MRLLAIVTIAAASATLAWPGSALAQSAPRDHPANVADLRCMAVVAIVAGQMGDEAPAEQTMGLAGGLMFYYGRLQGRSPDIDWLAAFRQLAIDTKDVTPLEPDFQRCGKEMMDTGAALESFGTKLDAES